MTRNLAARPTVLVVGDRNHPEFGQVTSPLEQTSEWTSIKCIDEAVTWLSTASTPPDVIILTQTRPGEISGGNVQRLRAAAPLVGVCAVLGNWCEGETRSGKPWPGVARYSWLEWPARWRDEVARQADGCLPLWTLPATLSEEERLLSRVTGAGRQGANGCVVVIAGGCETASALADAIRTAGFSVGKCHGDRMVNVRGAMAIVWDTTSAAATDPRQVAALKTRFQDAPLMALVTFPRSDSVVQMRAAGVDGVHAKPFLLDDLLAEIKRLAV